MTIAAGVYQYLLSLVVIAALVLAWHGGQALWAGPGRLRGAMVLGLAMLLFANLLIWAAPVGFTFHPL